MKTLILSDIHVDTWYTAAVQRSRLAVDEVDESIVNTTMDFIWKVKNIPIVDCLLLAGDYANDFTSFKHEINWLANKYSTIYLVLGNHDVCRLSSSRIKFYYEAGFDKVYDSPIIVNDKFILSHEPVYIAPGSNFINIYGHTHDEDICKPDNINNEGLSNYFMYDWDNWAMISKVYRKEGKEPPDKEQFLKYPERGVSPVNYYNVCWDMHNKILSFNDIITNCK
jgi:predicted phosphodiesterase